MRESQLESKNTTIDFREHYFRGVNADRSDGEGTGDGELRSASRALALGEDLAVNRRKELQSKLEAKNQTTEVVIPAVPVPAPMASPAVTKRGTT